MRPPVELEVAWLNDYFQLKFEIWATTDRAKFLELFADEPRDVRLAIAQSYTARLDGRETGQYLSIYGNPNITSDGVFLIADDLRHRISKPTLIKVYESLRRVASVPPYTSALSLREMKARLKGYGATPEQTRILLDEVLEITGMQVLFVTPSNWRYLPQAMKRAMVDLAISEYGEDGIRVQLRIEPHMNLGEIATRFGGPNAAAVQRYLERLRAQSPNRILRLPLQKILPRFIRRNLDAYDQDGIVNCLSCAVAIGADAEFELSYMDDELFVDHLTQGYLRVTEPQAGDMMVLRDARGQIVHAAIYISEELVFTKNGFSRHSPLRLQMRMGLDAVYQDFGITSVDYFRRNPCVNLLILN